MLKLHQFPPMLGLPNLSPFCLKLETYLRMANIPYEIVHVHNPAKAPKGKLPFIKEGDEVLADSGMIIDYLKQKYGNPLDSQLSPLQLAQNVAWSRLLDEHLYWCMVYSRWIDEANWPTIKPIFFAAVPSLLRNWIANNARKNVKQALHGHGMGRHTQTEIYQLGVNDLNALHVQLGQQAFFTGEKPCSIDASFYAYLANIIEVPTETPMKQFVLAHDNFKQYCERMKAKYYS